MKGIVAAALGALLIAGAVAEEKIDRTGWDQQTWRAENTPDARVEIRTGDIDNLGFGWEDGFTPFSGRS